jgi:preprotein translocase subunit Sec61beta
MSSFSMGDVMSRRNDRRSGRSGGSGSGVYVDPFLSLAADRAWRADDAVDNGSVTTSIPSYVGPSLSLAALGTGQAIKAQSAFLRGVTIASNGSAAANGYSAVSLAGAPSAFSVARVVRIAVTNSGMDALTVAGAVNSGVASFYETAQVKSRRVSPDVVTAVSLPVNLVLLSVYTATDILQYVNSLTATTIGNVQAFAGTTFQVMSISATGTYTLNGQWATAGYWLRALSAAEAAFAMLQLGRRYGITIAS